MSSIHRQHGKPNWFCAFTDPSGARCFRSTGTPKKSEAKIICETWGKAAKEVRNGSANQLRMRTIVERTISDIMMSEIVLSTIVRIRSWFADPLRTSFAALPHVSQIILASDFFGVPVLRKHLAPEGSVKAQNQFGLPCCL